jgi:hypothetical protein
MHENVKNSLPVTSHDREGGDRHPCQPEGGRPTAEGRPQPDAPGGRDPGAPGTPDSGPDGEAPEEHGCPLPLDTWAFLFRCAQRGNENWDEEVPDYPLMHFELLVLARYWAKDVLMTELDIFYDGDSADFDWRLPSCAKGRLGLIAAVLGPDAVREAFAEVEAEARRRMSAEEWRVFTEGGDEKWDQVHERVCEESHYLDRKRRDKEALERAFAHLRDHPGQVYFDDAGDLWYLSEPFRGSRVPAGRLVLRVTTPRGTSTYVTGYELEKAPEWGPPYGLR